MVVAANAANDRELEDRLKMESQSMPVIRSAKVDDAESVAAIYNHYVALGGATFDAVPWAREDLAEILTNQGAEVWCVAAYGQRLIGWASARRFSLRHGYRLSLESAIYLSPEAVGQGIADGLQNELTNRCRAGQIHHLMARIIADNHRSMAFHHRHGYELVGVQKEVGWMNDQWADVAILQKIL